MKRQCCEAKVASAGQSPHPQRVLSKRIAERALPQIGYQIWDRLETLLETVFSGATLNTTP